MRFIFFILLLAFSFPAKAQILLSAGYDTVTVNGELVYELRDTFGNPNEGLSSFSVLVQRKDSSMVENHLHRRILNILNRYGRINAEAISIQREALILKGFASNFGGGDNYFSDISAQVGSELAGGWSYRYNGTTYPLTADIQGRFRDPDNTLHLTILPRSETWIRINDQIDVEGIEMYRLSEGVWVGDGNNGRAILRKLN